MLTNNDVRIVDLDSSDVPRWRGKIVALSDRLAESGRKTEALRGFDGMVKYEEDYMNSFLNRYDGGFDVGVVSLALDNDELAGFILVKKLIDWNTGLRQAIVDKLVVAEGHEGRGIADMLLSHAEDVAANEGCSLLYIEHFSPNHRAAYVYERHGFSPFANVLSKTLGR